MPDSIDDLIPNVTQIRKEAALKEAEKAVMTKGSRRTNRTIWS
jgi:hypothetical protein